jgi:hypothetical protein
MAKLKALKDPKELSAIPLDEPVMVELEPPATGIERDEGQDTSKSQETESDGVRTLKEQLDAAKAATVLAEARATQERKDREEAQRVAEQRTKEVLEARSQTADSEAELINGSLAAAQAERDAAKIAYKSAFEAGDPDKMADAQSRMGRAEAKIVNFEGAAAELASRKEAESKRAPEQQQRQYTPEQLIDANPNLMGVERDWLKAHMDAFTDPARNNELSVGYQRALKAKLTRGTPEYFKFLEEFMGYSQAEQVNIEDEGDVIVSAPVTRENRSNSTGQANTGNKITLTPEQRELARTMGIGDIEYARQVQALARDKKANPDKYGMRG